MVVDWFTVGAQVLNFLVLVWLLKRYLYRPILDAIDAREKRIAQELASADAKKAEAMKEQDEFKRKNEVFDQQRAALLSKAKDEAKAERQRLIEEAWQAADALSAKRRKMLVDEARNLNEAVATRAAQEVFSIARKALKDLAAVGLEDRITDVFTQRLRELGGEEKATLLAAIKAASEPTLVRSAFDLSREQRTAVGSAVDETFESEVRLRFETAPELISGIELIAGGQKLAWSIEDYLGSLEASVSTLVGGDATPDVKTLSLPVVAKTEARMT
jgi:F-type H+-transporting ATPase subunit b